MLYHLDFQARYPKTISQRDLLAIWSSEVKAALAAKKQGTIIDLWKCVGTQRAIAIVQLNPQDNLDRLLCELPIMKCNAEQIQIEITPLHTYENFASEIAIKLQQKTKLQPEEDTVIIRRLEAM